MSDLDREDWATLLDGLEEPPLGTVAEALADARDLDVGAAYDRVEAAVDDDLLVEEDVGGAFGAIRVADTDETGDDPQGKAGENGAGVDKYRRFYLDAAERAGREPWEPVEEDALREALDAAGFAELLDNGTLFDVRPWRFVDVSGEGEEPRRRWYYPSGEEPRVEEFRRFDELLREAAPDDYEPYYFRVARAGKDPATQYGGWKDEEARLTAEEAVEWMREGGNVGLAGTPEDALVNVDIDDDEETTPEDVPTSLRARSRSRTGWHTWYFDETGEIPNIPTDEYGEVRATWQYVVAPGSFVASTAEEIPDGDTDAGYYTVEDEEPVARVEYDDLPAVFRDVAEEIAEEDASGCEHEHDAETEPARTYTGDGSTSGVFDVEAADLVSARHDAGDRFSSLFHGSDTGANMSVSGEKLHCWRHGVAHGGLQALAALTDVEHVRSYGCRDLGAGHKNSGAGTNALRGDWRLVWGAWYEAKQRGLIPDDDPIPYRALRELAVADGLVEREELVERDSETGDVADGAEADTYTALPSGTYNDALEHVVDEYDVDTGREPAGGHGTAEEAADDDDPRELGATVDPRRAWDAAGRVTPAEVDGLEAAAEDAERFASPAGAVDVVRAVALAEGLLDDAEGALDDVYPEAYALARGEYGAPLPEYYTTSDAVAEFDAVLDVIGEVSFWQLDPERFSSEVTEEGDEVGGDAVRALNPAWRESESEASVLVFESGTIWDADTERVLDAVRFAALDTGIIDEPGAPLAGEAFVHAYGAARDVLGAPLPRWDPATDGTRELTPQLPPSEELVDARDLGGVDPDDLQLAREEVEELIREATGKADEPTVVTSLPATGKTTGTVKTAAVRPLSYLAPRKELQAQALAKAERWGVDAEVLPVFADRRVRDEVLAAAVSHVRERGKARLRDRWAILATAFDDLDDDEELDDLEVGDIFTEEGADEDDVDLDRPTCETAEGEHGVAWALAVHVARRLGYTPREIHAQARGLFGASLPCDHGEGETCEYGDGWDRVTDADDPADLLVGSYTHAHVDSVRTEFTRAADGSVETAPRAVVLDEFVGEAYVGEFDEKAEDFATWLAGCLREDVLDRRDMLETDLAGDAFVSAWLDGEAGEADDAVGDALEALARSRDLLDAREAAREIRDEVDAETLRELGLADALDAVLREDAAEAYDTLNMAIGAVDRNAPAAGIARWADDEVREPLETATAAGRGTPEPEPGLAADLGVAGDLAALVDEAVVALGETRADARERLDAAVTALRGGPEGCRRLAAWADDGYAHPDAHHILEAVVVEEPDRIATDSWAFDPDATDGTVVDVTETGETATTILDRNGHGARIHTPPARTDASGEDVPLVGLDATGRAPLWSVALGEDVSTDDIHDTASERAAFLEDVLDLRVIQAADRPRPYEGDPGSKDTDGDVALLETMAEEYAGIDAPRERGDAPSEVGRPAAITTKSVREVLENDDRLDDVVVGWDHYGNVTGKNELGEHRLAAILGSQHYGDDAVERFAALAGESVDTSRTGGRGAALSYGCDLADEYLAHMREDQTTQAILRFARGDSGATVVARTSALRADLPVVGEGQVVETWNDTATTIAEEYRRLGREFTTADVRDVVDVTPRQVRRVLAELTDAGYVRRVEESPGRATTYERVDDPSAGEVDLPARGDAVGAAPGRTDTNLTYTWNVRVHGADPGLERSSTETSPGTARGPPAPSSAAATDGGDPTAHGGV